MPTAIESAEDFATTLKEVDLLLDEADACAPGQERANEDLAAALNKAALLLLAGKFEAFLESTAEEYLYALNQAGARACHIPKRVLVEHSVQAVADVKGKLARGDLEGVSAVFTALGRRWSEMESCSDLEVSCKFRYGKHGEVEIVKLFSRLGIDNIFAMITVTAQEETYEDADAAEIDVRGLVNSLTGIRNNILHQDASPTLTTKSLRRQRASLAMFAVELVRLLQNTADEVERQLSTGESLDAR